MAKSWQNDIKSAFYLKLHLCHQRQTVSTTHSSTESTDSCIGLSIRVDTNFIGLASQIEVTFDVILSWCLDFFVKEQWHSTFFKFTLSWHLFVVGQCLLFQTQMPWMGRLLMSINGTSIQTRADSKDDVHNFSRTLKNGLDDNLLDEPRASAVDELYCLRKVKLHGWGSWVWFRLFSVANFDLELLTEISNKFSNIESQNIQKWLLLQRIIW